MRIAPGGIVEEEDFFDREDFIAEIWKRLKTTSLILSGPRRFGKSSVADKMKRHPQNGNHVLFFDVEEILSPGDFVRCFFNELHRDEEIHSHLSKTTRMRFWADKVFDVARERISVKDYGILDKEWRNIGEDVAIALSEGEKPTVIIIDEFSKMVERFIQKDIDLENFLSWFRKLRQKAEIRKNCRFILTGSISIQPRIQRMKITDTINDLFPIEISPFDKETGLEFIEALCRDNDIAVPEELRPHILDLIGEAVPYFIQLLLAEMEVKNLTVWTADAIEDIYNNHILTPRFADKFQHYEDRFEYLDRREADVAERLLKKISLSDESASEDEMKLIYSDLNGSEAGFKNLMDVLLHDKYLKEIDGGYQFYLKILRDWWRRR